MSLVLAPFAAKPPGTIVHVILDVTSAWFALGGTWKRMATEIKQQLINSSKIWCFLESMFASPAIPDHFSSGFLRCSWVENNLGYLFSLKSER
jgi:hypothetical protein